MTNTKDIGHEAARFDAFLDRKPIDPWNQTLIIMRESLSVTQLDTGSVFVSYSGHAPEIHALMAALCGIYRGYEETTGMRWYFHAQMQPCLRVALLAMQDKLSAVLIDEISRLRR